MTRYRSVLVTTAALLLAFGGLVASLVASTGAQAATTTLCQEQTAPVSGGTYTVQNNEFDSSASECVTTDGGADFRVANSSIANATNGSPGAYPSIYQGCHWGNCSSGGLTSSPVQVSALTTGKVTTSWSTTQPGGSSAYDVAYDIWFNQTPTTSGQPNGTEVMVWLNHNGSVQPFGSEVASNVSLGGHTYNIWEGNQSSWDTVTYDMTSAATSVSNLDVGTLAQDSVSRGYTKSSWYLIDVEAGFELWQGGAGLQTNSFSVSVGGGSSSPTPTPTPTTSSPSPTPTPTPTSSGAGACSGTYSVTNSWQGGFQAQVVVKNTGSGTLNGWQLRWTFPGSQVINNLWNGSYTQSGTSVTVTNASYDGSLAPGATATVGFTANGSSASPSSVTCT
ncbi:MAG TPA: cellulose binding domain-containing protein [Trebonia sp.]|jgi:cellulose 1,4-beta-cellobiosidase|nr:cellulose binding domain-containing protein [Trebonia sp.]